MKWRNFLVGGAGGVTAACFVQALIVLERAPTNHNHLVAAFWLLGAMAAPALGILILAHLRQKEQDD